LAVVLFEPPSESASRFATLYVPPTADEMNKSRRMASLQARAFAMLGGSVALLDLRGTGDSGGEHGDATWEGWRADVVCAWHWLGQRVPVPSVLWGTRLGSLLAAELVSQHIIEPAVLLFWQPVISGRAYFSQLLRLGTAQQLIGRAEARTGTKTLREIVDAGASIEVGGYELNSGLVKGAEAADLSTMVAPASRMIWHETSISEPPALSRAASKIVSRWTDEGAKVESTVVSGPSFWATQEIVEAPELIAATSASIAAVFARSAERAR
jgi:exosortase A-associated hydrolase 2